MNRRGFLSALIGGLALDPERLLWVPGKKLISIPATRSVLLEVGDLVTFAGVYALNPAIREPARLKYFVVTERYRSGDALAIFPAPAHIGPYKNVSKPPEGDPFLMKFHFTGSTLLTDSRSLFG